MYDLVSRWLHVGWAVGEALQRNRRLLGWYTNPLCSYVSNQRWSFLPVAINFHSFFSASICPPLARPTHGIVSPPNCLSSNVYVGESCHIQCPQGFQPIGSSQSVCQNGPKWSLARLDCAAVAPPSVISRSSAVAQAHPTPPRKQIAQGEIHTQGHIVIEDDDTNRVVQPNLQHVQAQNAAFRPNIKCPRDTTIVLPAGQSLVYIKLEQPTTNVNWKT